MNPLSVRNWRGLWVRVPPIKDKPFDGIVNVKLTKCEMMHYRVFKNSRLQYVVVVSGCDLSVGSKKVGLCTDARSVRTQREVWH